MNQPLGRMAGNAVEVDESVAALEGQGPGRPDGSDARPRGGTVGLDEAGRLHRDRTAQLQQTVDSGTAREKFAEMVAAQGGDLDAHRPVAPDSPVTTNRPGYISAMNAEKLGQAVIAMRRRPQTVG